MLNSIARPIGILLMLLYDTVQNFGVAIILFAVIVKLILLPFQVMRYKRNVAQTAWLQPKLADLKTKHGKNIVMLNEETAKLYKAVGIKKMTVSAFIWKLVPFVIALVLFQVIRQPIIIMMGVAAELLEEGGTIFSKLTSMGFITEVRNYYVQISQSQFISANFSVFNGFSENLRKIDFNFIGLNLGIQPQWNFLWSSDTFLYESWFAGVALFLIPVLSGGLSIISGLNGKVCSQAEKSKAMNIWLILIPVFYICFSFITPAAIGFYWMIDTLLQIGQDIWLQKRYTKRTGVIELENNDSMQKRERTSINCPSCGNEQPFGSNCCDVCGAKMSGQKSYAEKNEEVTQHIYMED